MRTRAWIVSLVLVLMLAARARAQEDASAPETTTPSPTEASAPESRADDAAPPASLRAPATPLDYHLVISLGFSHWFGPTFGAPAGIYTPALTLAWAPVSWLEIGVQYAGSLIELHVTPGVTSQIGFTTLSLVITKEITIAGERLTFGAGPMVGMVYDIAGVGAVVGASIVARYLVQLRDALLLGPFIDARATLYELPGNAAPLFALTGGELQVGHADAQIQIGVAVAF